MGNALPPLFPEVYGFDVLQRGARRSELGFLDIEHAKSRSIPCQKATSDGKAYASDHESLENGPRPVEGGLSLWIVRCRI